MISTIEYTHEQMQGHEDLVVGGKQYPHKLEVNENMLRLYSHPICPFAERSRLAFLAKEIKHQIVHVDQSEKPDWFVEVGGEVPIMETTEGKLIPESDAAVEYAMKASNEGLELLPSNPTEAAKIREYVEKIDAGFMLVMYMGILNGNKELIDILKEKLEQIESELSKNTEGNHYLFDQKDVSYADIIISPILVRTYFGLSVQISTLSPLSIDDYPHVAKYVECMIDHPKLGKGYTSKWGFLNFIKVKQLDMSLKLPYPVDITPFEGS
jgi:glutathione S-transferase